MVRIFPTPAELPHRIFIKKHSFYALLQDFNYTFDMMISRIYSSLTHSPEIQIYTSNHLLGHLNLTVSVAAWI